MNTVGQNQKRRKSVVVMMSTIGVLTLIVLATLQFSSRRSKVEPWGGAKSSMVEDDRQLSSGDETATPTESPAPSPSPSEIPTSLPTITPMPTGTPTMTPTESPAPSPSPSENPTAYPTATPSATPSFQPTTTPYPTGEPSASPSQVPSSPPSIAPSAYPTSSMAPSQTPSSAPSQVPSSLPSVSPSQSPTFVGEQDAKFTVTLDLTGALTTTEQEAFIEGTEEWVAQVNVGPNTALHDPEVTIDKQTVLSSQQGTRALREQFLIKRTNARKRLENERGLESVVEATSTGNQLVIDFTVRVIYAGSDPSFSLFQALNPLFQSHAELWIHLLGNYADVFVPLRPSPPALETGYEQSDKNVSLTPGALAGIIMVALLALGLGVVASIYSMKWYNWATRGQELYSPRESYDGTFEKFHPTALSSGTFDDGILDPQAMPGLTEATTMVDGNYPIVYHDDNNENAYHHNNTRPSHGTAGEDSLDKMVQRQDSIGDIFRNNHHYYYGDQAPVRLMDHHNQPRGSDPPTASEVNYNTYRDKGALFDDADTMPSELSQQRPGSKSGRRSSRSSRGSGNNQELVLTKSMGGTLGVKQHAPSEFSASDSLFSSAVSANRTESDVRAGTLGARPVSHGAGGGGGGSERGRMASATLAAAKAVAGLAKRKSFDSIEQRAGLYDVFAPAGPIGIIVDTTKDGPAVHSLKSSSPMLGLINPGDLIVGLDDEDTRSMTAATLTRLMARKAGQKERKITLLAVDDY